MQCTCAKIRNIKRDSEKMNGGKRIWGAKKTTMAYLILHKILLHLSKSIIKPFTF